MEILPFKKNCVFSVQKLCSLELMLKSGCWDYPMTNKRKKRKKIAAVTQEERIIGIYKEILTPFTLL